MKMFFIKVPKLEHSFLMTTVLSGFGIESIFLGRSGTGFSRGFFLYTFNGFFYLTMQITSAFFFF